LSSSRDRGEEKKSTILEYMKFPKALVTMVEAEASHDLKLDVAKCVSLGAHNSTTDRHVHY
jgi:hypothetical protein